MPQNFCQSFDVKPCPQEKTEPALRYLHRESYYSRNAVPFTLEYLHNKFRDHYQREEPVYKAFLLSPYRPRSVSLQPVSQRNAGEFWEMRRRQFAQPLIEQPEFVKLKPQTAPRVSGCSAKAGFRRQYRAIQDGLD